MSQGLGTGLLMGRLDGRGFFTKPYQMLVISLMVFLHALRVSALVKDCSGFSSITERRDQIALREIDCHRPSNTQTHTDGFIMGYGGALTLVNGSPFDWVSSSTHSYQVRLSTYELYVRPALTSYLYFCRWTHGIGRLLMQVRWSTQWDATKTRS
jgi:hypothetical protein